MAFGNKLLFIFVNGQQVANSKNMEMIFKGLEVSSDGNSNGYQITQGVATFAETTYNTVVFRAVTAGLDGNSISLIFNGSDDVDTVIGVWNAAHPTNTVAYVGTHGADVLGAGTATLSGAVDYTGGFDFNAKKIHHLADATTSSGAATKGQMDTALSAKISTSQKGVANGVCPLESDTKISTAYLPSYVDDVLEYADFAALPTLGAYAEKDYVSVGGTVRFTAMNRGPIGNSISLVFDGTDDVDTVVDAWNLAHSTNQVGFSQQTGDFVPDAGTATLIGGGVGCLAETGKIYVTLDNGKIWRYSGTIYVEIVASPGSTDLITEGVVNLFFTEERVLDTLLDDINDELTGPVTETDSILEGFGRLENRMTLNDAKVGYTATAARSDLIAASITEDDTTHAPDGDSVFTALAGKAASDHNHTGVYSPVGHGHVAADVSDFTAAAKSAAVVNSMAGSQTDQAPSVASVQSFLASAFVRSMTNKHTSAITIRQFVYASAAGQVKLAKATDPDTFGFGLGTMFGVVQAASIEADAAGYIYVPRSTVLSGFSGLVVGSPLYLSRDTAGAYAQDLTGFTTGDHVVLLGTVISATEIVWNPKYLYQIVA
jgi:hypothetical protein